MSVQYSGSVQSYLFMKHFQYFNLIQNFSTVLTIDNTEP